MAIQPKSIKRFGMAFLALLAAACSFQQPDYLKTVTADELNRLLQTRDIFLVDVHTPEQRHIKGTDAFIPYDEVEKYQDRLPADKSTPIYLYCERGPMANAASRSLYALGYHDLTNLEGGANAWRSSGLPLQ